MPLYEYICQACNHQFEALVRKNDTPSCPSCKSEQLERVLSLFAVNSEATRQSALASGRKAAQKNHIEKRHAEAEAIKHHSH